MTEPVLPEEAIFARAREIASDAERAAFLDRACGDDSTLRAEVEALLHADDRTGDLLDLPEDSAAGLDPTVDRPDAPAATVPNGTGHEAAGAIVAGRYRLLEPIGEGGMGTVWMAEQRDPVKRLVALKLIKPGMDSKAVLARFEAERQALALMNHPNIASIFDGGTTRDEPGGVGPGRPYFVMELVKGRPLTEYCDARRLSIRDRLELFVPICSAMQHAHQKGIIHRDLKPSNILVTEHDSLPVPKVIDFGLAKALGAAGTLTARTLYTAFGTVLGTPLYMAPEQVGINALDIDTRTDIYALGVILYELLTGATPLEGQRLMQAAWEEIRRLIREEEPPRPSVRLSSSDTLPSLAASRQTEPLKLARLVRGDLDWIVMKCLEKDRSRRYDTANSLARDIERHLHDEPVEASPPSRWYRLWKFVRKHRSLIGTAVGFILLVAAGAGVSAWQAIRARAAEREALAARDDAAEQLRQAKRSEGRAQDVLKFFQDKVLSAARPKGQEGGLSREATIREALDRAEPEISRTFASEPLVEASIRNTLGVSYWYLGAQDLALRQQERALDLRRRVLGPEHPDTVGAMNDVAIILNSLGRNRESQRLLEEVVALKRRTLGPEDRVTLRSVSNLAGLMAQQGEFDEAIKLAEEALSAQRRVEGPEAIVTLRSGYNVATMWRHLGRVDEARRLFEDTLRTLRRAFGPENQDTLRVTVSLGEVLLDLDRPAEARELFEQAIDAQTRVLGAASDETILTMSDLADALRALDLQDEARATAEKADQLHRHILGPDHPQSIVALTILADIDRDSGRLAEARKEYEEALGRMRRILPPKTFEAQRLLNAYAWMLATAPDPEFRDPRRAVELANEVVQNSPTIREIWTTLGVAHYRAGAWNEAIAALERSEAAVPGRFIAVKGLFRAMAYWQLGEKQKAREWYAKAVPSVETAGQSAGREWARFRSEASRLLGIADPRQPSR